MEPKAEPVDSVAAVAAGVAAGAQQIDECMADIGDLMADMFGAVAVAIDGQAQGGPRAVVAARRRQRELDEQAQRDREQDLVSANSVSAVAAKDASPLVGAADEEGCGGASVGPTTPRVPSSPSDRARPGAAGSGARILQAGSRGSPLAAGGSPRTPEPPAALPSLDEEARARQRAESRAEEMRLRNAFAQEKLAVEKLRTPTSQADAGTDSDLNAE